METVTTLAGMRIAPSSKHLPEMSEIRLHCLGVQTCPVELAKEIDFQLSILAADCNLQVLNEALIVWMINAHEGEQQRRR